MGFLILPMLATKKDLKTFGLEVRRLRTQSNLTQTELAKRVGFSCKQLNHIEYGVHWPSMEVYIGICRALGIDKIPMVGGV